MMMKFTEMPHIYDRTKNQAYDIRVTIMTYDLMRQRGS